MAGITRANNPGGLSMGRGGDSVCYMTEENIVTFYLHASLRQQAESGNHNFIKIVSKVLQDSGLTVAFDDDDMMARLRALSRPGRSLVLMGDPIDDRGLTFRKTYIYPFWHIEKQAKRWEWPVAQETFDPSLQSSTKSTGFHQRWCKRLFDRAPTRDGFIYVPLQGQLTEQRSFQACPPIAMIEAVLEHDPTRNVLATLHPREVYSPADLAALEALEKQYDRLVLAVGGSTDPLLTCDYIVTQNSGAGFMGYFLKKPLVLFAQSEFHHIALNVRQMGVASAFDAVPDHAPDYAAYLNWFLQQHAINAGRPEAEKVIRRVLRRHGWPV